jgi:Domain of unknown function (DUF4149)
MMKPMPRRPTLLAQLPLWLAALWWGSLSTIGFLVVPLLFVHLPTPALAGALAAKLFTAQTWVSVLCGLFLLAVSRRNHPEKVPDALVFVVGGMLLALLADFAVAPRIVARDNIALWHRVGSGMYLLQWLCAGASFWKISNNRPY